MFEKRCKICSFKVARDWNYCPNCGSDLKRKQKTVTPIFNFFGMFEDAMELFSNVFDNADHTAQKREPVKSKYRQHKETEEPKIKERRIGGNLQVEISLPDVKNEKDIDIIQMEESYEVRAYAGDKMYFKIIPTSNGAQITKTKFSNGKLTIEMS